VVVLTEEGAEVMRGERAARLLLPEPRGAAAPRSATPRAKGRTVGSDDGLDAVGLELFEALRRHRLGLARARGVPPYVIASDRTLREIAALRPLDVESLLECHGVGPARVEAWGEGLLEVVREHAPVAPAARLAPQ
jgi:ATP-dependent DNA helicase RecQ